MILKKPLKKEIKYNLTAVDVFSNLKKRPYCFWLDSGMDKEKLGRFSFMGADPFMVFRSWGERIVIEKNHLSEEIQGNPFDVLSALLDAYRIEPDNCPIPFTGGAVGYFGYDMCRLVENLPDIARDDYGLPDSYFAFYDVIVAFDHLLGKTWVISTGFPEVMNPERQQRALHRLNDMEKIIGDRASSMQYIPNLPKKRVILNSNFSRDGYMSAVEKARQYIIEGDIFEVNLSQRFEAELPCDPFDLYLALRDQNPAPFACYLDFNEVQIAGASPERFIRVSGRNIETRPIKGTLRRGKTAAEDSANADSLQNSIKDNAENMMIVDLERNDLGKVCSYGSVTVPELAILEKYPTVFHLTSTITGQLREDVRSNDLMKAVFPGGSITGAPKIRAMEIIEELEPTKRGIYTGSIGYLSFNGNMDSNIVIRTYIIKGDKVYFQVGGAVVYDSDPENEYIETLDKGRALMRALNAEQRP